MKRNVTLTIPGSVSAGTAVDVSDLVSAVAGIAGTFVATFELMVSFDGVTFSPYGTNLTAPGTWAIPDAAKMVRIDCTAYTSGAATGGLGGVKAARLA